MLMSRSATAPARRLKGGGKVLNLLLSAVLVLGLMPAFLLGGSQQALAAAQESISVQLVGKNGEKSSLASWTYDSENETYKDAATGKELSIVEDYSENPLVYTGRNKKPDPRCLSVTTKGIELEDLFDYASVLADGIDMRGDTCMFVASGDYGDMFTYDQYWGLDRYCYMNWWNQTAYSSDFSDWGEGVKVPSVLAIKSYHAAAHSDSGAVSSETPESLASKADAQNALRVMVGQQKNGNTTLETSWANDFTGSNSFYAAGDINEGFLSVKSVDTVVFTPNYRDITVLGGIASGTQGVEGYSVAVENGVVTASDNWFKAAKGETVRLTVAPDDGYELDSLSVETAEDGAEVEVAADGSFVMPGSAVTVSVALKREAPSYNVNLPAAGEYGSIEAVDADGNAVDKAKEGQRVYVEAVDAKGDKGFAGFDVLAADGSSLGSGEYSAEEDAWYFEMKGQDVKLEPVWGSWCTITVDASKNVHGSFSEIPEKFAIAPDGLGYFQYTAKADDGFAVTGVKCALADGSMLDGISLSSSGNEVQGFVLVFAGGECSECEVWVECSKVANVEVQATDRGTVSIVSPDVESGEALVEGGEVRFELEPAEGYLLSKNKGDLQYSTDGGTTWSDCDEYDRYNKYYQINALPSGCDKILVRGVFKRSATAPDTITTAAELKLLAEEVNDGESKAGKTYALGADIDLSGIDWKPIGGEAVSFAGTFDGAGHSVTGLSVNSSTGYAGLFGNVSGTVKDFTVSGSVSSSAANADYVGGVAGKLSEGGTISGVIANVAVTAESCFNVGGIAGFNGTKGAMTSAENTVIENCVNNGAVVGCSQVGGIAGENAGIIKACANTGKIDATKTNHKNGTGGIAGRNGCNNTPVSKGTILDCYNTGEVGRSGMKWVGGITGLNNAASAIARCYNTGAAHGTNQTNPLVGRNEASSASHPGAGVHDCWYLDSTKVTDESGVFDTEGADASVNCGLKTADEMKSAEFALLLNGERTGDAALWNADASGDDAINDGFPVLAWQGGSAVDVVLGDVNGDGQVNSADAGVLISYCLNEASLGDAALAAADVNGDGSVNSADAGILISYCLNEIDSLG